MWGLGVCGVGASHTCKLVHQRLILLGRNTVIVHDLKKKTVHLEYLGAVSMTTQKNNLLIQDTLAVLNEPLNRVSQCTRVDVSSL